MLRTVLKVLAPIFVLVGLLHLFMGLQADVLLGATLTPEEISDPVLDSQNRFYGVAVTAYGFLLYLCAGDLVKFGAVFKILLAVFFAAGCARVVSIVVYGLPPVSILVLLGSELILPPILAWWYRKTIRGFDD